MKKLKAAFLFALAMLPIGAVAAYFTILYQIDFVDAATLELTVSQLGSIDGLIAVYILQIGVYTLFCSFIGYILASKLGLMKPIRFEKGKILPTLVLSLIVGGILSLDYWTFGNLIPGIQEADAAMLKPHVIAAGVLYGGIVEELMLRLFFMSFLAWLLWKLFFRKHTQVPTGVLIASNVMATVLFAAGHLPATVQMFGTLTPLIVLRCFLLNGCGGLAFGWLYRKYGIQYSMLSHGLCHIISKGIWLVFI